VISNVIQIPRSVEVVYLSMGQIIGPSIGMYNVDGIHN